MIGMSMGMGITARGDITSISIAAAVSPPFGFGTRGKKQSRFANCSAQNAGAIGISSCAHGKGSCSHQLNHQEVIENFNFSGTTTATRRLSAGLMLKRCKALEGQGQTQTQDDVVYQGIYGPWTIEDTDVREVILYRTGLVVAAASFVAGASTAIWAATVAGESSGSSFLNYSLDLLYVFGASGLGLSLYLIHIYVTPIKRTLQALWALGVAGSLATYAALARPSGDGLVLFAVENPYAIWFVGPLFAALTGLVFKEGLCYGKLEAGILTFIIPTLLLGHLSGLMDDGVKLSLLGFWMALFTIFAARKFTQPIKDDIGDKSVFIFDALPEEKKKAVLEKLDPSNF